jgi:hypothetical protein
LAHSQITRGFDQVQSKINQSKEISKTKILHSSALRNPADAEKSGPGYHQLGFKSLCDGSTIPLHFIL